MMEEHPLTVGIIVIAVCMTLMVIVSEVADTYKEVELKRIEVSCHVHK